MKVSSLARSIVCQSLIFNDVSANGFRIFQDHSQYRSNKCCVRHRPTIKFSTIEQSNFVFFFCQLFLGARKLNAFLWYFLRYRLRREVTLHFSAQVRENMWQQNQRKTLSRTYQQRQKRARSFQKSEVILTSHEKLFPPSIAQLRLVIASHAIDWESGKARKIITTLCKGDGKN